MTVGNVSVCLLLLLLTARHPCAAASPASIEQKHGIFVSRVEEGIIQRINRARINNGLRPLKPLPRLRELARAQSRDMADNGYLDHVDSRGRDLEERVNDAKISGWREIGENVAKTFGYERVDETMVKGWLRSRHHRANIMNGRFNSTGVGVVRGGDGYYYATQVFMGSGR